MSMPPKQRNVYKSIVSIVLKKILAYVLRQDKFPGRQAYNN